MILIEILFILSIMFQGNPEYIFDFKNTTNNSHWVIVDDGVMGGLSKSTISINDTGKAIFKGYVTTEINGGFSSIRYAFTKKDVNQFKHVVLRLKGDGKLYQFRIKENSSQYYSYITTFKTSGDWETLKIPFSEFYPSFRGYQLDKANFSGKMMEEIAFLIGNKTKESFVLEIENIYME